MSVSSSINSTLIVMALGVTAVVCGLVAVHTHPELLDSVKTWFSEVVKMPRV